MKTFLKSMVLSCLAKACKDVRGKMVFYHDIFNGRRYTDMGTPFSLFKQQMELAEKHGFKLTGRDPVNDYEYKVCFDDGFAGLYECRDFFVTRSASPTVFIAPTLVGQEGYLNWSQILELSQAGFDFQSHTLSHVTLTDLTEDELYVELDEPRKIMNGRLGRCPDEVCFPRGCFSPLVVRMARQVGYKRMYTSVPGVFNECLSVAGCEGADLRSRTLVQNLSAHDFVNVLKGGMLRLQRRYMRLHFTETDL